MNRPAAMDRAKKGRSRKQRPEKKRSGKQTSAAKPSETNSPASDSDNLQPRASWQTFLLAAASAGMLWAALPPLGWWPLAYVAPLPWLWLIQAPRLPGRRPHWALWLVAFLHWLAVLQGVRLAHPALYAGWIALCWYLAFYPLLFVIVTRVALQRTRLPLVLAAPAVWVGLELLRGHALTGFSGAMLGHTQYQQLLMIQISDLTGAYGVSFVVMLVAAALASGLPWRKWWPKLATSGDSLPPGDDPWGLRWRPAVLAIGVLALASTLGYGAYRQAEHRATLASRAEKPADLQVALLQESVETIFDYNRERSLSTFRRYMALAKTAVEEQNDLDLIVWPESTFNSVQPVIEFSAAAAPPPGMDWSAEEFAFRQTQAVRPAQLKAQGAAIELGEQAALLVGTDVFLYGEQTEHFNSAVLYSPQGQIRDRYYKMHRVMFGEYIPFGEQIPLLYQLTPMHSGLTPGRQAEAFELNGVRMAPNICFESFVPHLIRRQVNRLAQRGETPDVQINLTNDGWFKGSSILDLHHACSVFRAVENRRPLLVAANIGITAEIEANGAVRQQLPRKTIGVLQVPIYQSEQPLSFYTRWGDWPAGLCLLFTLVVAAWGAIAHFKGSRL